MSKRVVLAVAMVSAVAVVGWGAFAYAGEGCAAAQTCTAAKAAGCDKDMKVTMTGKIEVKTEKVDGKDAKVPYLTVSNATCEKSKECCPGMNGKSIKISGAKAAEAEKLDGKTVEAQGTCKGGKEFDVASLTEKK